MARRRSPPRLSHSPAPCIAAGLSCPLGTLTNPSPVLTCRYTYPCYALDGVGRSPDSRMENERSISMKTAEITAIEVPFPEIGEPHMYVALGACHTRLM